MCLSTTTRTPALFNISMALLGPSSRTLKDANSRTNRPSVILLQSVLVPEPRARSITRACHARRAPSRSDEHTSELQSLMRISYAVFCLKKKQNNQLIQQQTP